MPVHIDRDGPLFVVTLDRPEVKNAVDRPTADALAAAFREFDADPEARVLVLTGAGGTFSAGADLKAVAEGRPNRVDPAGDGPMGPTRMVTTKPTIAAIAGHAVAGGLELALLCDLRVVEQTAVMGVFCRRFGVPLIDGGTVRLPRIVGLGRALDLVLTGRPVHPDEALAIGLANRVVPEGAALEVAKELGRTIAAFPWACVLSDRRSVYEGLDQSFEAAMARETELGIATIASGETLAGATGFAGGRGRHGAF